MTPQDWYRHICRTHAWAALFDLSLHLAVLLFALSRFSLVLPSHSQSTWIFAALVIFIHLFLRAQRTWAPELRWKHLSQADSQGWSLLLRDLAISRGHFPNAEYLQKALDEARQWPKPKFPIWTLWKQGLLPLSLAIFLLGLVWSSNRMPSLTWGSQPSLSITLTAPSYLNLPTRVLHPMEHEISVFPGSLLHWEGLGSNERLSDSRGRNYLQLHSQGKPFYEARILEELTFTMGEQKKLLIKLLEDQVPTVAWMGNPEPTGLQPLVLTFEAHDDHGLNETLITVNGREIEYAGKALHKKSFAYRWTFNPRDHLNLMGGNVSLQIAAYDNDRIKGPKVGHSPTIVWEFPGLGPLASQSLQTLAQLKIQSRERLNDKSPSSAKDIGESLEQLKNELSQNPAISPQFSQMLDIMEKKFQRFAQQNSPQASIEEKRQIQSNLDLLNNVEKLLSQIMQTIEAAELVQNLKNLAKELNKGKNPHSEFLKVYDKMEKHLRNAGIPPQIAEQILDKINEAELSAAMGDSQSAAKIMESLAEILRTNPSASQGQNGDNPMSKKFQQLMKELQHLITRQQVNQSMLNMGSQSFPKGVAEESLKLRSELRNSPAWNQYQRALQNLRRPNLTEPERSELMTQLTQTQSPVFKGRNLDLLDQQLSRLAAGSSPTRPMKELLATLNGESEALQVIGIKLNKMLSLPKVASLDPETEAQQKSIAQDGLKFSRDFRLNFEPLLPMPELYQCADMAGQAALQAQQQLRSAPDHAEQLMGQALFQWIQLQQALQNLQEQSKNNSEGQGQSLSIGSDGKLQLQPQGQKGKGQEGDGEWQHKNENLDIALPEDFKNAHLIEQQLKQQLQNAPNDKLRRSFQKYMMDLLE